MKRLQEVVGADARPTPIQAVSWSLTQGSSQDLIGVAETGAGKTFAFLRATPARLVYC